MSKNVKFKIFNFTFWGILKKTPTHHHLKLLIFYIKFTASLPELFHLDAVHHGLDQ